MNFRDHVRKDTASWPAEMNAKWAELALSANGGKWRNMATAELEVRAWLEVRDESVAREPVVLNRHHLTPHAAQPLGSPWWPRQAIYVGRAPITAPPLSAAPEPRGKAGWVLGVASPDARSPEGLEWRFSHLLGNRYSKDDYPSDALERYRLDLRGWMREDNAAAAVLALGQAVARRHPAIDAIRELTPLSALVCSCVSSPWTPVFRAQPGERLPSEITCHCHLIVAAWRSLQPRTLPKTTEVASVP